MEVVPMWFEHLVGFREESPEQVRGNLTMHGDRLTSKANGRTFRCGKLELPSLAELRESTASLIQSKHESVVSEIVGDVQELHCSPAARGALFQVASQFNLLEMAGPTITPEHGIDRYETDRTQGPACAIACGAGTIYRNYFVDWGRGCIGQTTDNQIDCLYEVGRAFGNESEDLWCMKNGYALATAEGLRVIGERLTAMNLDEQFELRGKLRVGLQWDTEVTLGNSGNVVSQVFGSALPIAYCPYEKMLWEPFARFVLEASYEATLLAAALNRERTGNNKLFLTLLGGGAFGNPDTWILDAIKRALRIGQKSGLEIKIVSYRTSNPAVRGLADDVKG